MAVIRFSDGEVERTIDLEPNRDAYYRVSRDGRQILVALSPALTEFNPEAEAAMPALRESEVRLYDLGTGRLVRTLFREAAGPIRFEVTRDGTRIVTVCRDSTIKVRGFSDGRVLSSVRVVEENMRYSPEDIVVAPDDQSVVVLGRRSPQQFGIVRNATLLVGLADGKVIRTFSYGFGDADATVPVAITPDSLHVATMSENGMTRAYRLADAQQVRELGTPGGAVGGRAVTSDGRYLVSLVVQVTEYATGGGDYGSTISIWGVP